MKITLKFCNDSWIKFLLPDVVLVIHKICIITCSVAKRQSNSEPSSSCLELGDLSISEISMYQYERVESVKIPTIFQISFAIRLLANRARSALKNIGIVAEIYIF